MVEIKKTWEIEEQKVRSTKRQVETFLLYGPLLQHCQAAYKELWSCNPTLVRYYYLFRSHTVHATPSKYSLNQ